MLSVFGFKLALHSIPRQVAHGFFSHQGLFGLLMTHPIESVEYLIMVLFQVMGKDLFRKLGRWLDLYFGWFGELDPDVLIYGQHGRYDDQNQQGGEGQAEGNGGHHRDKELGLP